MSGYRFQGPTQRVRVELDLPEDIDPSTVLDLMQEFAVERFAETGIDTGKRNVRALIDDAVSVEVIR